MMHKRVVFASIALISVCILVAYLARPRSAGVAVRAEQPALPSTTPSPERQTTRPSTRPAVIAGLIKEARRYIAQNQYQEALLAVDEILEADPANAYAVNVRPLIEERARLQAQRQQVPSAADASTQPIAPALRAPAPEISNEKE